MKPRRSPLPPLRYIWLQYSICALTILMTLLMVVPVSVALAAGIASVSLILFGFLTTALLLMLIVKNHCSKRLLLGALSAALFGLIIPQAGYIHTANRAEASLSFDPLTYLHFSGATSLSPSRILTYKSKPAPLQLALYEARGTSRNRPLPTVILLHGGGWRYGSHLETGVWAETLTRAGFHVVSVEYRLSSDTYHSWRDAPADVHDAITYLTTHSAEFTIDPARLTLFGQSAGGHLALLEAYRNKTVESVISLYAPIDLELDYVTSRDKSAELDFIGGPPSQYPDRYRALSPLSYVSTSSPRSLIVQGTSDDLVHPQNARLLGDSLAAAQVDYQVLLIPLTGHSFENQRGGFATQITTQRVLDFLQN